MSPKRTDFNKFMRETVYLKFEEEIGYVPAECMIKEDKELLESNNPKHLNDYINVKQSMEGES